MPVTLGRLVPPSEHSYFQRRRRKVKLDMQEIDVRFTTVLRTARSLEFVQDRWFQVSAHRAEPVITNPLTRNRDITVVTIAFVTSATSASVAPSPRTPYEGTARKGDQS